MSRRKILTVLFVLAAGLALQSCKFLKDEFFQLGKAGPDLQQLADHHARQ